MTTLPRYKAGKQTHPIELETMQSIIENPRLFKQKSHQSYLAFLYLTGVRRNEALETVKEDYSIEEKYLRIHIPSKKRGTREQLILSLDMPFMNLILEQIQKTAPTKRIWNFKRTTTLNLVKRAMGDNYYPHFLRLNRSVHFLDDPTTTIPEMQSWFGWRKIETINNYLGYSQRHLLTQAERLKTRI